MKPNFRFLIIFLFFVELMVVRAQSFQWAYNLSPANINDVKHDKQDGGVFVFGDVFYKTNFNINNKGVDYSIIKGDTPGNGSVAYVAKYDSLGSLKFAITCGAGGRDENATVLDVENHPGNNFIFVLYRFSSKYLSQVQLNNTNLNDPNTLITLGSDVVPSSSQNVIVLYTKNGAYFSHYKLASLTTRISDLGFNAAGDMILTGSFSGTTNIGFVTPYNVTSVELRDAFIARYTWNSANVLSCVTFGGPGNDLPNCMTISPSGTIAVGGTFNGATISAKLKSNTSSISNSFAAQYNTTNTFVVSWSGSNNYLNYINGYGAQGNDLINDLKFDDLENCYAVGTISGTSPNFNLNGYNTMLVEGQDGAIICLNNNGSVKWYSKIGGGGSDDAQSVDFDGNDILVSGYYKDTSSTIFPRVLNDLKNSKPKTNGYLLRADLTTGTFKEASIFGGNYDDNFFKISSFGKSGFYFALKVQNNFNGTLQDSVDVDASPFTDNILKSFNYSVNSKNYKPVLAIGRYLRIDSNRIFVKTGIAANQQAYSSNVNASVVSPNFMSKIYIEYGLDSLGVMSKKLIQEKAMSFDTMHVNTLLQNLSINKIYYYRIVLENGLGVFKGKFKSFTTKLSPPEVLKVVDFTDNKSAVLTATLNPNGTTTTVKLYYGLTKGLEDATSLNLSTLVGEIIDLQTTLNNLLPSRKYYYQYQLTNNQGTRTYLDSFVVKLLPPKISALNYIYPREISLNAAFNPNGQDGDNKVELQYGLSKSYSNSIRLSTPVDSGYNFTPIDKIVIKKLKTNTLYYLRIKVSNELGVVYSRDTAVYTLSDILFENMRFNTVGTFKLSANTSAIPNKLPTTYKLLLRDKSNNKVEEKVIKPSIYQYSIDFSTILNKLKGNNNYQIQFKATNPSGTYYSKNYSFKTLNSIFMNRDQKLFATQLTYLSNTSTKVKNNIYTTNGIFFGGEVTIDGDPNPVQVPYPNRNLSGTDGFGVNDVSGKGDFKMYDGGVELRYFPNDGMLGSYEIKNYARSKNRLRLAGLQLDYRKMRVENDGLSLEASVVLPGIISNRFTKDNISMRLWGYSIRKTGIDVSGDISLSDVRILNILDIKRIAFTFDTKKDWYTGFGDLKTPLFDATIYGEMLRGKLNAVNFSVSPLYPILVGTTGIAITRFGGGLAGLVSKPVSINVNGDLGFVWDKAFSAVKLNNLFATYTVGTSLEGGGQLAVFGINLARGGFMFTNTAFNCTGYASFLDIVKCDANLGISFGDRFYMSGSSVAEVSIPDLGSGFPADLVDGIIPDPLFSQTVNFSNDEASSSYNVSLAVVSAGITYGLKFNGFPSPFIRPHFSLHFPRIWPFRLDSTIAPNPTNPFEGRSIEITDAVTEFKLEKSSRLMVIRVKTQGQIPDFDLECPNGQILSKDNLQGYRAFYKVNFKQSKTFYCIENPELGNYKIILRKQGSAKYHFDIYLEPEFATLKINKVTKDNDMAVVETIGKAGDNPAKYTLFYDRDTTFADGAVIGEGKILSSTNLMKWNISQIPQGEYFIYAFITDTFGIRKVMFKNPIVVTHKNYPTAPFNPVFAPADSGIKASWQYNGYKPVDFMIEISETSTFTKYKSYSVGSDTSFLFKELVPGASYFMRIVAMDSMYKTSLPSKIVKVDYVSPNLNNAPYFTSQPVIPARVGQAYYYRFFGKDYDNDALTYSLKEAPNWLKIDSSGSLTGIPDSTGLAYVELEASDGQLKTLQKFYIEVSSAFRLSTENSNLNNVEPLVIIPNPAKDYVQLDMQNNVSGWFDLTITDAFGKRLATDKVEVSNGKTVKVVSVNWLRHGAYIIELSQSSWNKKAKLIKQ